MNTQFDYFGINKFNNVMKLSNFCKEKDFIYMRRLINREKSTMPDLNFTDNLILAHRMGNSAIFNPSVRYITKESLKTEISTEKFKEYEKLFDYIDKNDNTFLEKDGKIDLAAFGDATYVTEHKDNTNVCFVGELFTSNNRAEKLGNLLNISIEKLQGFFNILYNFQVKRDSYLEITQNSNMTEENRKVVDTAIRNNINGTQTVINRYSDNTREQITRNENQIFEEIYYDKHDKMIEKNEYKYVNNKKIEKICYDANNEITEKSKFLYFKTEDEAQMYVENLENNLQENIVGFEIGKDNEEYVVTIIYEEN